MLQDTGKSLDDPLVHLDLEDDYKHNHNPSQVASSDAILTAALTEHEAKKNKKNQLLNGNHNTGYSNNGYVGPYLKLQESPGNSGILFGEDGQTVLIDGMQTTEI